MSAGNALLIDTITDVRPLDAQMGVEPKLPCPPALHDALFGQSETGKARGTFAILDAAVIDGLAEMLENAGLAHRCLFQGDAARDLAAVAPWIVELKEDHPLTRNLFIDGSAAWQLWGISAIILFRAAATLEDMRDHFRRFTRVQDAEGKWYFMRFWESDVLAHYFRANAADAERAQHWFRPQSGIELSMVLVRHRDGKTFIVRADPDLPHSGSNRPFILDHRERDAFRAHRWQTFLSRLAAHLADRDPRFGASTTDAQLDRANELAALAFAQNIRVERAVADFATAVQLSKGAILSDVLGQQILASDDHELDKAAKLLEESHRRFATAKAGT